jgi:hypothetical protein
MLPNPDDLPSGLGKGIVVVAVASDVAIELLGPVVGVCARRGPVLRAPMPEAPVNEHRDSLAWEYDVSSAAKSLQRSMVLPKPEPPLMQLRAKRQLWPVLGRGCALNDWWRRRRRGRKRLKSLEHKRAEKDRDVRTGPL